MPKGKKKATRKLGPRSYWRQGEERLSDREKRVLKLYYGVGDNQPRTLDEVGEVFDLCKERIRQLRDEALGS